METEKKEKTWRIWPLIVAMVVAGVVSRGCSFVMSEVMFETESEKEYRAAVEQLYEDVDSIPDPRDLDDPESTVETYNRMKAAYENFLQVTAPERYAAIDEELKETCRISIETLDLLIAISDETDQEKIDEYASRLMELLELMD